MEVVSEQGSTATASPNENNEKVDKALAEFFRPIHEEYLRKQGNPDEGIRIQSGNDFKISRTLVKNLLSFTDTLDFMRGSHPALLRMYSEASQMFDVTEKQSDLHDLLLYHPVEAISTKAAQVLFAIALTEPQLALKGMQELQDMLDGESSRLDQISREVYGFVLKTITALYETLSGQKVELKTTLSKNEEEEGKNVGTSVDYDDMSDQNQAFLIGLRGRFIRRLRTRPRERYEMLKLARKFMPANVEWIIFLCHSLRMKRRSESAKSRNPTMEESEYLEAAWEMEPMNPFVRVNLIDSVVDAVRELNGRFKCGDSIILRDMESAIYFLEKECRSLCHEFPNNVHFKSIVSDYFVRYVPYLYFNKEFSGKLLEEAFALNPQNARTTHRLGIFHRMLMKNIPESLKWLEKTIELDPTHFNGHLDYFKTILGKPELNRGVGQRMEDLLNSPMSQVWKPVERYEFLFHAALAYFSSGEREKTLELWSEVLHQKNQLYESWFALTDVDRDSSIFKWDPNSISTDLLRTWIHKELDDSRGMHSRDQSSQRKKNLTRIFRLMFMPTDQRLSILPSPTDFPHSLSPEIYELVSPPTTITI